MDSSKVDSSINFLLILFFCILLTLSRDVSPAHSPPSSPSSSSSTSTLYYSAYQEFEHEQTIPSPAQSPTASSSTLYETTIPTPSAPNTQPPPTNLPPIQESSNSNIMFQESSGNQLLLNPDQHSISQRALILRSDITDLIYDAPQTGQTATEVSSALEEEEYIIIPSGGESLENARSLLRQTGTQLTRTILQAVPTIAQGGVASFDFYNGRLTEYVHMRNSVSIWSPMALFWRQQLAGRNTNSPVNSDINVIVPMLQPGEIRTRVEALGRDMVHMRDGIRAIRAKMRELERITGSPLDEDFPPSFQDLPETSTSRNHNQPHSSRTSFTEDNILQRALILRSDLSDQNAETSTQVSSALEQEDYIIIPSGGESLENSISRVRQTARQVMHTFLEAVPTVAQGGIASFDLFNRRVSEYLQLRYTVSVWNPIVVFWMQQLAVNIDSPMVANTNVVVPMPQPAEIRTRVEELRRAMVIVTDGLQFIRAEIREMEHMTGSRLDEEVIMRKIQEE